MPSGTNDKIAISGKKDFKDWFEHTGREFMEASIEFEGDFEIVHKRVTEKIYADAYRAGWNAMKEEEDAPKADPAKPDHS